MDVNDWAVSWEDVGGRSLFHPKKQNDEDEKEIREKQGSILPFDLVVELWVVGYIFGKSK